MSVGERMTALPLVALLGAALACGGSDGGDGATGSEKPTTWGEVQRLYEKARRTGEDVPGDAYEWMKQDLEKIGDWEYRVLAFDSAADAEIERKLNELGQDRWECFAVVPGESSLRLLFKRPVESYAGTIPHSDLLKLMRREEQERDADSTD